MSTLAPGLFVAGFRTSDGLARSQHNLLLHVLLHLMKQGQDEGVFRLAFAFGERRVLTIRFCRRRSSISTCTVPCTPARCAKTLPPDSTSPTTRLQTPSTSFGSDVQAAVRYGQ